MSGEPRSWWLDDLGRLSKEDPEDVIYLCESDDDPAGWDPLIRWQTTDRALAESLVAEFNAEHLTREQGEDRLRERGLIAS